VYDIVVLSENKLTILISKVFLITVVNRVRVMMFYATFNNISVISWRSVLLVEETWSTQRKAPTCRKSLTSKFQPIFHKSKTNDNRM
jgi:hypothetical protein